MKVLELTNYLDNRFPITNASDIDLKNTGLVIGSKNIEVTKVLCALDLTLEVANEAIQNNCNFIITHHPFLFNGIYKINYDTEVGQIIKLLFLHNISLYCVHTALDVATNGVNDTLARKLKLENIEGIEEKNAFLRIGTIEPTKLIDLAKFTKETFELGGVRVIGDENKIIQKVGIIGGGGSFGIFEAKAKGCDCLITGEIRLNNAIDAKQIGLCVIEVNHGVERFVFESLAPELEEEFKGLEVKVSKIVTDPLYYV